MKQVVIPYTPRAPFLKFHETNARYSILTAHRGAGKTVAAINHLIKAALTEPSIGGFSNKYGYLAPYREQAKKAVWDLLKYFTKDIPDLKTNEQGLTVRFPNGAVIGLYGTDNADIIRGNHFNGVVIDEPGDMADDVYPLIIAATLVQRRGWEVWIGTPKGRNHFYEKYVQLSKDPKAFSMVLKASESGLIPQEELNQLRIVLTEAQYQQEFECNFDVSTLRSIYGNLMTDVETKGHILDIPHDPAYPVTTAWDLGTRDLTVIWFCQQVGFDIRLIDYYEGSGYGYDHYVKVVKDKPYVYNRHIFPHDLKQSEQTTGKSRLDTMIKLGVNPFILPVDRSVHDGIHAVRTILSRCWFDKVKCERGIEALKHYQFQFSKKLNMLTGQPLHDWTSHAADSFRYLAKGLPGATKLEPQDGYRPKQFERGGTWMSN